MFQQLGARGHQLPPVPALIRKASQATGRIDRGTDRLKRTYVNYFLVCKPEEVMGCVYLNCNSDLYKIGHAENLERRLKQLKPYVLVQSLVTDRSFNLEQELHS